VIGDPQVVDRGLREAAKRRRGGEKIMPKIRLGS